MRFKESNRKISPCSQHGKGVFHTITLRQKIINNSIQNSLEALRQDGQQVEDIVLHPQFVDLGCFHERVDDSAGLSAIRDV